MNSNKNKTSLCRFLKFKKILEEFDVSNATALKPKKYYNKLFGFWGKN